MGKEKGKVVVLEERVPKLKEQRRQRANRLLVAYIALFFMLLLGVVYAQSPLSNVAVIHVEGNHHIASQQIIQLSGITKQTSFWKVKKDEVEQRVKQHPEVKDVSVKKRIPNRIDIVIVERTRIAYILDKHSFLPILDNGKVLTYAKQVIPSDAPILVGWKEGEAIQDMAAQLANTPNSILNLISEIHYTPNASDERHITVYMNDGIEVSATIDRFAKKIVHYPSIVSQLQPGVKGVLHLEMSAYFKPYKADEGDDKDDENER
ncbi:MULTISPECIES: cell division protein FtsQ/DivIB [Anoxybacillus]|uniref:Cell division protein DivIB n=1 Tax=Anoxybacillus flavithermus TaxID=33934 RepID=A0A178TJ93_9BACL|nr:cell division protein FtsQ/DivIB [Anoxybacillus flavithermus]ASA96296.1 cell division protein FtsQ [Anoxybacillus flavithermus]ELK21389.1 cell-division initiation protein [Anoxybacillus flavithermus TNO-09.006]MBE2903988.1 cell division protein FtsQ/DivIB [Anoxybacillus flavithermus]MBE2906824.1 cell division protein FtsQ/DivIB [Anoxybacillus flavithermus]MBE2909404.1 cell division protein FtsQ/DivIB [Anoxybacillus flavithermus]